MTATILENITSVRASLDELEAAYHTAAAAVTHYNEVAGRLVAKLGTSQLPGLLALPAPVVAIVQAPPPEKAPAPTVRPKAKPAAEPVTDLPCFRAKGRDAGPCRGKVALVCCAHAGCNWSRALCEAHREHGREGMALSAHHRVVHTTKGKVALRNLQRKGVAARDGRPKHRRKTRPAAAAASGRSDKPRHPAPATARATTAADRRSLIAQRARALGKPAKGGTKSRGTPHRCLVCDKVGHNARSCPRRRREEAEVTGETRPAAGALDVAGLEELDAGHTVAPRGVALGVEE